ncbi:hypothetical protein WICPIJ_001176 [Wickerhamomyces pijperi]|uniref:Uncharacterized protein n=1 Tax=Wickerhamomyces pijperi TaxID=599730 RepID=A0A9P8QE66_WICPI|nr:hypothetical protein WICPIJ_001176 [Wickerhamomyces pijperi]
MPESEHGEVLLNAATVAATPTANNTNYQGTTTSDPDTVDFHNISKPTKGFLKNDFQTMKNYSWKLYGYANTHDSALSAYIENTDILMKEFMKGAFE